MNITTLKSELQGILHGTTLNKVVGLNGVINRAARQLLIEVDPQETKRTLPFVNPIFSEVFDYALPVDLKGNRVIDIRPQVNRNPSDYFAQWYNQQFDRVKTFSVQDSFSIQFNTGFKFIRINAPTLLPGITINSADSVNDNGVWATTGTATNVQTDNVNFASGSGSLKFDLAANVPGSIGGLENANMNPIDLSEEKNQSSIFFWVYLPTASQVSSVSIKWGSSNANYYTRSMAITSTGTIFQDGWNLLQANWLGATQVGVPDDKNIGYLAVDYTYNGLPQTAIRLDSIVCRQGSILEIEYYSKYMFRDLITGGFQETVTDDTNVINLDTESYNLLLCLSSLYCVQQLIDIGDNFDLSFFTNQYNSALARYKGMYKSEVTLPQIPYYTQPNPSYRRFFGRGFLQN